MGHKPKPHIKSLTNPYKMAGWEYTNLNSHNKNINNF